MATIRTRQQFIDLVTNHQGPLSWSEVLDFLASIPVYESDRRVVVSPPMFRVFDAQKDFLPDAATSDDLGVADAAGSPAVSTACSGGATAIVTQKLGVNIVLPETYKAGSAITLRVRAKLGGAMTVSGTIDALVKKYADGALGSDVCATAAQNLATDNAYANYDFTITPTGLVAGDVLNVVVVVALDDTGGTANKSASIAHLELQLGAY